MVSDDPLLARVHSTKAAKSSRGPVVYGPREIGPPAPAGGGGIRAGRGDPWGNTQRKHKTERKNGNKNGGYTHGGYGFGRFFCHTLPGSTETRNEATRNSQIESLIIPRVYSEHREHTMTFKNRQTLTERTGAFKDRTIREEDETHLESNKHQPEGETGSQGTHGEQNTHKTVHNPDTTMFGVGLFFFFFFKSNDAENSALHHINKLYFTVY